MSTDSETEFQAAGVPELTPLGKRIELLRLERRMSKRILAQRAGTSRQQLWRVMTGKSDLTSSLCARLSDVLETDSRTLRDAVSNLEQTLNFRGNQDGKDGFTSGHAAVTPLSLAIAPGSRRIRTDGRVRESLEEYVASPVGLERTLETLPNTDDGRRLKRVLLDAIEEIAIARAIKLPQSMFDLRRDVVNAAD